MNPAATPATRALRFACVLTCLAGPLLAQTPDAFNPNPNNVVYALAVQPDGKVLMGGFFSGFIGSELHNGLGRANADGSLDVSFVPVADGFVGALALQPNGAVVAGGNFGSLGGLVRSRLARVSADGVVDPGFNPGADQPVECLALQPDGKILVGGFFGQLAGQARNGLGRLNPDGSLDTMFNPGTDWGVTSLIVQPDGKILVGGWFGTLAGTNRAHLGRLNADGSLDATFNPGADNFVNCLALQADGKILVGGWFTNLAGQGRNYIGRLNADGSLDAAFNPGASDQVFSLAIQTDGEILAGGYFTNLSGVLCNYLGRLNTNGVFDTTFNPGAGGAVSALAIQADGKVLVGGWFNSLGGASRSCLGRLNNTAAATQAFSYKSSKVTWLRGGPGPEIGSATFDASTDGGNTWTNLGTPARVTGGWQLTGVSVANSATVRARGFLAGGQYDGSGWFVETNLGPLAIVQQPASRTNIAGTLASLTVRVGGGSTPAYQWRKHGTNLFDTANLSGSASPSLVLSNVFGGDAGAYTVVITDSHTTLTSQVATVTVYDPHLTTQPVSQTNPALTSATFTVAALGQASLSYAWLKNGAVLNDQANLTGSHTASLTLSNVLGPDAGAYRAIVSDAAGSVTSSPASLTVIDPYLASQPANQGAAVGGSASFNVGVFGSTPMTFQWSHNSSPILGANSQTLNLSGLAATDAGFYQVAISNVFGVVTSSVATLTVNYATADAFSPALYGSVNISSLAIQPDGKLLLGGIFGAGGCPYPCVPSDIGRFNPDGSIDFSFYESANNTVAAICIQTNGSIIIGGAFTGNTGDSSAIPAYLTRFTAGGQVDDSFVPGPDAMVRCLALQSDGRILVGGDFTHLAGQPCSRLGRLLPDRSFDASFNLGTDWSVASLAVQPDGKILVAGNFSSLGSAPRSCLGRLNADGSLDTGFNPGPNGQVNSLLVQPDGKIVVGGAFGSIGGFSRTNLARLNPDGSADNSFYPGADSSVVCLGLQTDGRILVGGSFANLGGVPLNALGRLNADGTVDLNFNPGAAAVASLALQKDGALVVGGAFSSLAGQLRAGAGRLNNSLPAPAAETLAFDNSSVTWLRSGTGPESWRATFELSTDGANWTPLGAATRIPGGWQLTGLAIPSNSIVRARGFVAGGGWFIETVAGLPVLTSQPVSLTNNATTTAAFAITAYGGTPLYYQWLKNGAPLASGGNAAGTQTPTLTLTNVLGADAGAYSIILSNATGSTTSSVAGLTVIDPWLSAQPISQAKLAGAASTFALTALGTTPLSFQWLQNGTNLSDGGNVSGSQTATLIMTNLSGLNAGAYAAIVTNVWGSVTSSAASLGVVDPYIYTNPVSQAVFGGQGITLRVVAAGERPLSYQWWKNSTPVPTATNSSLVITSAQGFDAGSYRVLVADAFGSVTSSAATLTVTDPFVNTNPTNQYLQAGQTVSLAVTAGGGSPLSFQWLKNRLPVTGATNASLFYTNAQGSNAGFYSVVVSDAYASVTSSVAAVTVNSVMADGFNPGAGSVQALALQPDGKILMGGGSDPGTYNKGSPGPLRLNPDGSPDPTFVLGLTNSSVNCLALQPDGKILVGGFVSLRQRALYLSRLNSDGSVDGPFTTNLGAGPNGSVYCLTLQADGKMLLGGSFSSVSGQAHANLARLNSDGTLDTNFNPTASSTVYSLAIQPNGAILVGGQFTTLNGQTHPFLGRLNSDGSLDTNFNASATAEVMCLTLQANSTILVGGAFAALDGLARLGLGRLNSDGTVDTNFNLSANYLVYSLIVQTDGRILVGGAFTVLGSVARNHVGRLNADGSVDMGCNPGASGTVGALALQPDGAILVAGQFTNLAGLGRTNIGRLINSDPATQSLVSDAASVTWLRGGTSPEVWRTTFESSTDGLTWTALGAGQRIAGGWQLAGLSLTGPRNLRARGFVTGGYSDGSSWFAETVTGPPTLTTQPVSRTNQVNTTAMFYAVAGGDSPLRYQWLKAGLPLTNGGNVFGATTAVLSLSNVFGPDASGYAVLVTNASGAITSSIASLTVVEPILTRQPTNQTANAGDTASFSVAALGTAPFSYQWLRNGTNFSSVNAATLTLANISRADAASYSVRVSTPYGSALSSNATLTINLAVPDSFNPGSGDVVRVLAPQTDGKILIGYDSSPTSGYPSQYLTRVNPDGSLDASFNPGMSGGTVWCLSRQPDGELLVGGTFATVAGLSQPCLARLNPDGSADATFRPAIRLFYGIFQPGITSLAIQPDGKIVVGGFFDGLAGGSSSNLCRLNLDGSCDTNFLCNPNNMVRTVALESDGNMLIGGDFTDVNGEARSHIARVRPDGSVDSAFNPATDNHVYGLVVQPDGRILVAGQFTLLNSVSHNNLGRLNADGSLDTNFTASANNFVNSLALQADGRIIVGGYFGQMAGLPRTSLGRLNADGTPDTTFFPTLSGVVSKVFTPEIETVALTADGTLLLGGEFTAVNGQPRASIARLSATDAASQYLSSDGQSITWLRGGTTPELWSTTFETSSDGTNWMTTGAGSRIAGGWLLNGLALPANTQVRASGLTSGAYYQGSGWPVQSLAQVLSPAPVITNDSSFGFFANQFTFSALAVPGQVVVIEASTDFAHWTPVQTNVVTVPASTGDTSSSTALFTFTESQAGLYPHRFYRARLYVGGLPAPNLSTAGSAGFTSSGFGFNQSAVRGQTVVIEASTNLANWSAIATNSLATGSLYFSDPGSTNFSRRFYRARLQ